MSLSQRSSLPTLPLLSAFALNACEGLPENLNDTLVQMEEAGVRVETEGQGESSSEFDASAGSAEVVLIAFVDSISTGSLTVDGLTIGLLADTGIEAEINAGEMVTVKAYLADEGSLVAVEVKPFGAEPSMELM